MWYLHIVQTISDKSYLLPINRSMLLMLWYNFKKSVSVLHADNTVIQIIGFWKEEIVKCIICFRTWHCFQITLKRTKLFCLMALFSWNRKYWHNCRSFKMRIQRKSKNIKRKNEGEGWRMINVKMHDYYPEFTRHTKYI